MRCRQGLRALIVELVTEFVEPCCLGAIVSAPLAMKSASGLREGKMQRRLWRLSPAIVLGGILGAGASAQNSWTWQQVKEKFVATNPTLKADQLSIDESRAA